MLTYPEIDPVIFSIGPVAVRWYGTMYLLGFLASYWLGRRRAQKPWSPLAKEQVEDLVFYGALGAVLGGRVGYTFFYGFERLLEDPLWLFRIWEGGMSFHGGLLGVILAIWLFARKSGRAFGDICDFVAPLTPLGLGFGRLANFINAELYGRATDVPWAMVFPGDPQQLPRHPSQLYQFVLEGVLLFALLWWFSAGQRPRWAVSGMFLIGYSMVRLGVEFFREPDATLVFGELTRGQFLSLPMLLAGVLMIVFGARRKAE
ncbi:MAG: prolipoprotein diacylglyceryl transferase [Gammaproteobacteria bacterium]|nr:prolipoprotein diacylglyceryl transferase [Gammaproteobacteria bacterium]